MKVHWEASIRDVLSEADLSELLREIRTLKKPTVAFLEHSNGRTLAIGVGGTASVMTYVDELERTYHSLGDRNRQGTIQFSCRGEMEEFLEETAVPEVLALAAVWEFFRSGNRPSAIVWEADW